MAGRGEHRHQLVRAAVFAHQHRRQLLADLHQVGQVGDVVFGDQVLDHADAFQPAAGAQRLGHLAGIDPGHRGDGSVGLLSAGHLELDQQAAQFALVTRQRAVQQHRALGRVELQQVGQRVDVLLHQGVLLLQVAGQPVAGCGQHGSQVLRRVLDVLVEVEEERAFFIRAAPRAVALDEGGIGQRLVAAPLGIALAAAGQVGSHTAQHHRRPHQVAADQAQQAAPVTAQVELAGLAQREGQHEVRAQLVQHRRIGQPG